MSDIIVNKLLSVVEAMERLNYKRTHFYSILNNQRLRGFKQGRRTYIRSDDLDAFIAALPEYLPRAARHTGSPRKLENVEPGSNGNMRSLSSAISGSKSS